MGRKYCWWLSLLSLAQRRVYCWICELSHAIQWTFLHLCQLSKSWVKKRWNCKHYWTGDRREILKLVNKAFILCAEQYYNTMEAFIPWYTLCIALPPFTENITLGYMNENRLEIQQKKTLFSWECWPLNHSDLKVVCSDILYTVAYKLFNSIKHYTFK